MNRPRRFHRSMRRLAQWVTTVVMVWCAMAASCWAQGGTSDTKPKTYVPSYVIIIFAVGLALMIICRGGKRSKHYSTD